MDHAERPLRGDPAPERDVERDVGSDVADEGVWVRFDDMSRRTTTRLTRLLDEIRADSNGEVRGALDRAQEAAAAGHWVGGYISYDAACAFDESFVVAERDARSPALVWFGVFASCEVLDYAAPRPTPSSPTSPTAQVRWAPGSSPSRYVGAVETIREHIRRGDVYQVNLTTRLTSVDDVDPRALYHQLLALQQPAYGALINVGATTIMSASPELFFEWRDSTLRCRPMKGTRPRGRFDEEDARFAQDLITSTKEQAENIMIVDLVRNDMAKIAELGSVRVSSMLEVESYPQVHQLVSEIVCRTPPERTFYDVVAALFPSGSITGAPKSRAMALIAATEDSPRGVYCGAVGFLAPHGAGVHARFAVAIRTATARPGRCEFGAGGGIVFDSDPVSEHQEMMLKARQLEPVADDFELLETFRHDPGAAGDRRRRHLRRLHSSARRLGFACPPTIERELDERMAGCATRSRVRLRLSREGALAIELEPLGLDPGPVTLAIDDEVVNSDDETLFFKTTRRDRYDRRRRRFPEVDDVVMVNERGECTETTIANLMVRFADRWYTPPLSSGCLPGIGREIALESSAVSERVIRVDELRHAREIAVVSSLRGWRRARLRD